MRRHYSAVIWLLLVALLPGFATGADKLLRVGAFEWQNKTQSDGSGAYFDLLRRIYEPHGYRLESEAMSIDNALGALYRQQIHIMLAEWHPRHLARDTSVQANLLQAPHHPIDTEYVVVLYPDNTSYHWEQLLANKGARLAWIDGYDYHQYLNLQNHSFDTVNSSWTGIRMLTTGKLDAFIDDLDDIRITMLRPEASDTRFRREVIMVRNLYPLFSRTTQTDNPLAKIYDQGIRQLIDSGEIRSIYLNWDLNWNRVKHQNPQQF